jgi:hypothetical protein
MFVMLNLFQHLSNQTLKQVQGDAIHKIIILLLARSLATGSEKQKTLNH